MSVFENRQILISRILSGLQYFDANQFKPPDKSAEHKIIFLIS